MAKSIIIIMSLIALVLNKEVSSQTSSPSPQPFVNAIVGLHGECDMDYQETAIDGCDLDVAFGSGCYIKALCICDNGVKVIKLNSYKCDDIECKN